MSTFKDRFNLAFKERGLKQSQISQRTGIDRGSLSCYLKGRYEPKGEKLFLLADILRVSPEWLQGQDVPMHPEAQKNSPEEPKLSEGEQKLIDCYRSLSKEGQESLNNCIESLGNFSEETQKLALRMLRSVLENQ